MDAKKEELIESAVRFLKDPKVQSSPLAKKVAFLESKGLTPADIEIAIARSNGTTTSAPAASTPANPISMPIVQMHQPPPPPPPIPRLTWKDYFIAATIIGGVGYGALMLAKVAPIVNIQRYLGPLLDWPSGKELEKDQKDLESEFDKISTSLESLQEKTLGCVEQINTQEKRLEDSIEETNRKLKDFCDKEEKSLETLQKEIEQIRTSLPQHIEEQKQSIALSLREIQADVQSLKALWASRNEEVRPSATNMIKSGLPAWQLAGNSKSDTTT